MMCVLKRVILMACFSGFFLTGCAVEGDRTDAEMLEAAIDIYHDYLFEYGVDGNLFSMIEESISSEVTAYKWVAIGSTDRPVGLSVTTSRLRSAKPKMKLIGTTKDWFPYVGSKHQSKGASAQD